MRTRIHMWWTDGKVYLHDGPRTYGYDRSITNQPADYLFTSFLDDLANSLQIFLICPSKLQTKKVNLNSPNDFSFSQHSFCGPLISGGKIRAKQCGLLCYSFYRSARNLPNDFFYFHIICFLDCRFSASKFVQNSTCFSAIFFYIIVTPGKLLQAFCSQNFHINQ